VSDQFQPLALHPLLSLDLVSKNQSPLFHQLVLVLVHQRCG